MKAQSTTSPKTVAEAVGYYSGPARSLTEVIEARWSDGVVRCPTCNRDDVRFISTRRMWECKDKHPRRQFSAKVGTIFEDSPLGLDKWLVGVWLIANAQNGISSHEIGRALGITQKSAWFMLHRIRLAARTGIFAKMSGDVEVDQTHVGGKPRTLTGKPRGLGLSSAYSRSRTLLRKLVAVPKKEVDEKKAGPKKRKPSQ